LIKSRKRGWVVQVTLYREMRIASRFLGGKPEGKKSFGRTGLGWNVFTVDLLLLLL
jgi:hypothetical protein